MRGAASILSQILAEQCCNRTALKLRMTAWIVLHPSRYVRLAIASVFLLWPALCASQPQARGVLCSDGDGNYDAAFRTGVKVHVGAARHGGPATLATRACAAKLDWENQELVVAEGASKLDLDAFGVDLGDGVPTAAFQIKQSDSDCCVEYRVYSLERPPRLLRSIRGGDFFSASDTDLDGSVEIWTDDAAAVDGFEKLTLSEFDSAPTVVFRFAHGQLLDVNAEFQSYFDNEIAGIRAGILPQDLEEFKNNDGQLAVTPIPASAERLHRLRSVKIKVLEIVWAYLYSGRDGDAWRSLAEMWPSADLDRIHGAILKTRELGIHSQADGTSTGPPRRKKKHAPVFDAVGRSGPGRKLEVVPPEAILLQRPATSQQQAQPEFLDLVVDESGKVRSVEPEGKGKWVDPELMSAALTWKFIPAFKDGRNVASRMRIAVSAKQ